MSDPSNAELNKNINRLIDSINGNNFSSGKARQSANLSGDGLGLIAENLAKGFSFAATEVGKFAGKAMDNTATVADASDTVSKTLSKFGLAGGLAGDALSGMTSVILDIVDNWQKLSDVGLQFGGNSAALNDAVKKTGLSTADYANILDQTKPAFANFGQGLTKGAEMFGEASNSILNNPTLQRSFNLLGMNTKEVNTALATVVRGAGLIDTTNKERMDTLLNSALQLAREMDIMAKLTGVSRKEQEKNIETMQQDIRIRAALSEMRETNPNAAEAVGTVQNNLGSLAPEIGKLINESMATGGVLAGPNAAQFSQIFGADMLGKIIEMGRNINSTDPALQREAIEASKTFHIDLATSRKENRFITRQGMGDDNPFAKIAFSDNMEILAKNLDQYTKKYGEVEGNRMARKDAEDLGAGKLIQDLVRKNADGTTTVIAKKGEDDPRAKTTEIVTGVNSEVKRLSVGLNQVVGEMNNSATIQKDANGKFKAAEIANDVAGYNKAGGSRVKDMVNKVKVEISVLGDVPEKWTTSIADKVAALINNKNEPRAVGSKKATGSWWEKGPKNILMGEGEREEAVVPKDDMGEFINDIMMSSGMVSSKSTRASSPNLGGILRNISSKVSAAQDTESTPSIQSDSTSSGQDPVLEKLDKLSTIMERVALHSERTERHASDTASNTKDIGPYIR